MVGAQDEENTENPLEWQTEIVVGSDGIPPLTGKHIVVCVDNTRCNIRWYSEREPFVLLRDEGLFILNGKKWRVYCV